MKWLATYNNCKEVRTLASKHHFQVETVKMQRLHADADLTNEKKYKEIIICPANQELIGDKKMGRPKGSANKPKVASAAVFTASGIEKPIRKRVERLVSRTIFPSGKVVEKFK